MALERCKSFSKKIAITISEKKSSATARVIRNSLIDGFIRFPRIESAPIASATSVGMAIAQELEPGLSDIKIIAGANIPNAAHRAGKTNSLGLFRPCLISSPISVKKAKVKTFESTLNLNESKLKRVINVIAD